MQKDTTLVVNWGNCLNDELALRHDPALVRTMRFVRFESNSLRKLALRLFKSLADLIIQPTRKA